MRMRSVLQVLYAVQLVSASCTYDILETAHSLHHMMSWLAELSKAKHWAGIFYILR